MARTIRDIRWFPKWDNTSACEARKAEIARGHSAPIHWISGKKAGVGGVSHDDTTTPRATWQAKRFWTRLARRTGKKACQEGA
jgi:hypothetical protein